MFTDFAAAYLLEREGNRDAFRACEADRTLMRSEILLAFILTTFSGAVGMGLLAG